MTGTLPKGNSKANDIEYETLLEEQANWFQNQMHQSSRPTVRLIQMQKEEKPGDPSEEPCSVFRSRRKQEKAAKQKKVSFSLKADLAQVNVEPSLETLSIGDIVERTCDDGSLVVGSERLYGTADETHYPDVPQTGFPVACRRTEWGRKKSGSKSTSRAMPRPPDQVMDQSEAAQRVAAMSAEERAEAVSEIESVLGRGLVDRLRRRAVRKFGSQQQHTSEGNRRSDEPAFLQADTSSITPPESASRAVRIEVPGNSVSNVFVVDSHEANKLLWSTPAGELQSDRRKVVSAKTGFASFRFHLNGTLLRRYDEGTGSENDLASYSTELYHHGDEPHLTGYTLNEIVDCWLPSVNTKQRLIGLRTLRKIAANGRLCVQSSSQWAPNCWRHSELWCTSSAVDGRRLSAPLLAGFGEGLKNWERYLFEILELHWKAWLCSQSSDVTVRIAALQLLADLLLPDAFSNTDWPFEAMRIADVIEIEQPPTMHRVPLAYWPSSYRRVIMPESFDLLTTAYQNKTSLFSLDESEDRLSQQFASEDSCHEKAQRPVCGLSAFDPVVHLLLAVPPFTEHNPSPASVAVFFTLVLSQTFGNPFAELAVIRVCVAFALHSKTVALYSIVKNSSLMFALQRLAKSLTVGSPEAEDRTAKQLLQDPEHDPATIQLRTWLLYLLRVLFLSTGKGSPVPDCPLLLDTMTVVVFLRQILLSEEACLEDEASLATNSFSATACLSDVKYCRFQAFKLLSLYEVQKVWQEDIGSYYPVFLQSIRRLTRCFGNTQSAKGIESVASVNLPVTAGRSDGTQEDKGDQLGHLKFSNLSDPEASNGLRQEMCDTARMECVQPLDGFAEYLWSILLARPDDEDIVPMVLSLAGSLADVVSHLEARRHIQDDLSNASVISMSFLIEFLHLLKVLSLSLWHIWEKRKASKSLSEVQVHYLRTLAATIERCHTPLAKLRLTYDAYLDEILGTPEQQRVWAYAVITLALETGFFGQYVQIPRYHNALAQSILAFRVITACAELEFVLHNVLWDTCSQLDVTKGNVFPFFLLSGFPASERLVTRFSQLKSLTDSIYHQTACLGGCQRQEAFCGAPDVIRCIPFLTVLYDTLYAYEQLLQLRHVAAKNNDLFGASLSRLEATCTTAQLKKVVSSFTALHIPDPPADGGLRIFYHFCCGQRFMESSETVTFLSSNALSVGFRLFATLLRTVHTSLSSLAKSSEILSDINYVAQLWFSAPPANPSLFDILLKRSAATSLLEQLCVAYSALRSNDSCCHFFQNTPLETLILRAWDKVERSLAAELTSKDRSANCFVIRLEQALNLFLVAFKQTPMLPELCYTLLDTFTRSYMSNNCQRIITTDGIAMQLLRRHRPATV